MPRKKRLSWLPEGVTEYKDRHGKKRYRYRKTGLPDFHFKHQPGTEEFREELLEAMGASTIKRKYVPFSMDDLAQRMFRSPRWISMQPASQYTYKRIIERYLESVDRKGRRYGSYPAKKTTVAGLEKHLSVMSKTPAAANNLRKALKRLFAFAVRLDWMKTNPAAQTEAFRTNPSGWHTWTDEEIERFRAYWAYGTMARLTLELALNTAARRCNLAVIERDHIVNGRLEVAHVKGNEETSVTLNKEVRLALEALPAAPLRYLITSTLGKPFTVEGLGNRFRKWAKEADCPTNLHGLRKGVSRQLAEKGVTASEGRAITGHKNDKTFMHYAAKADRKKLADTAHGKLIGEPDLANLENTE